MVKVINKKNEDYLFEARTMAEAEGFLKKHNLPIVEVEVSEWTGNLLIYTEIRRTVKKHYILKTPKDTLRRFEMNENGYLWEVSVFTGRDGRSASRTSFSNLDEVEERGWEMAATIPADLQLRTLAGCRGRIDMGEVESALHNYPYTF